MPNNIFPNGIPEIIADYAASYELIQEARNHQEEIDDQYDDLAKNSRGCDHLLNLIDRIQEFGHEFCKTRSQEMWICLSNNPCASDIFDKYPDEFRINSVETLHPWSERLIRSRLHELSNWEFISGMPEMVDILRENQDKIVLNGLVKNQNALDLIESRMDAINNDFDASWTLDGQPWAMHLINTHCDDGFSEPVLCNPGATQLILKFQSNIEKRNPNEDSAEYIPIDWDLINIVGNMEILDKYPEKIDLDHLTNASSPGAVKYVRNHIDDLSKRAWANINCNPAMIDMLIDHPSKIDHRFLGLDFHRRFRFLHCQ